MPRRSSPTRKARGSNPPGRTKKSPCNVLCKVIFYIVVCFSKQFQNSVIGEIGPSHNIVSILYSFIRRMSSLEKRRSFSNSAVSS